MCNIEDYYTVCITVLWIDGLMALLLVTGGGEMAVLPAVTAVLLVTYYRDIVGEMVVLPAVAAVLLVPW
jgi:hypothetical protein